jgi:tRNA-binding EMAP/Myf-like protein
MSEWQPEIVVIDSIEPHPNADTLSIATIYGGAYKCLVKNNDFLPGDMAAWLPLDTDVDTSRSEFSFLVKKCRKNGKHRIKAMRLRGIFSQGLLLSPPNDRRWSVGDSVVEAYALEKYLPPSERDTHGTKGNAMKKERRSETWAHEKQVWKTVALVSAVLGLISYSARSIWYAAITVPLLIAAAYVHVRVHRKNNRRPNVVYYDIDSLLRHPGELVEGEEVVLTEKLHGSNAAFVHTGKRFHAKSRTVFRDAKPLPSDNMQWGFSFADTWSNIAKKYDLEAKLAKHPGIILRGEIVGPEIQKGFHYGNEPGMASFWVFDAEYLDTRKYMDYDALVAFCKEIDVPIVPLLHRGPWNDALRIHANGKSTIAEHTREGFVVKCAVERFSNSMGRINLKLVGEDYMLTKQPEIDE